MKYEDLPVLEKPECYLRISGDKISVIKGNREITKNSIGKLFFTSPMTFKDHGWLHPEYKYAYANNLLCKIEGRCELTSGMRSLVCKVVEI